MEVTRDVAVRKSRDQCNDWVSSAETTNNWVYKALPIDQDENLTKGLFCGLGEEELGFDTNTKVFAPARSE